MAMSWLGCAGPRAPAPAAPVDVMPSATFVKGSLFGTDVVGLPNGQTMTPDAAPGSVLRELDPHIREVPALRAGNAVATALSPDGGTLLVLTSGFNRTYDAKGFIYKPGSSEYVFVYDVSRGAPQETAVVPVPNAFGGIAFDPTGARFYVAGGSDDALYGFSRSGGGTWKPDGDPVPLGHMDAKGYGGLGLHVSPFAAGVGVTPSGALAVVANHENDSISIVDLRARRVLADVSLTPGGGAAGGEFPMGVLVVSDDTAYVSCQRDREVAVVDLGARKVARRIRVGGQPTRLVRAPDGAHVYVANANSDTVSVIDTRTVSVVAELPTAAPKDGPGAVLRTVRGSNPNALALSPDGRTLYVTNGGNNTVAVLALGADGATADVTGLIPTPFYPNAITLSRDGGRAFVAYGKSPTGPNPGGPWVDRAHRARAPYGPGASNQLSLQLTKGGLLSFPLPSAEALAKLTEQSLRNNRVGGDFVPPIFTALRGKITHVILVIAENRSYDQILGDLPHADGDRSLVLWGRGITPNQHALAERFVTLDRFFDSGGVSGDGWQWTVGARTTDVAEKAIPVEYASRGHHSYDWEGTNRNINVGQATVDERRAWNPEVPMSVDLLPGTADVGGADGPSDGGRGLLWDSAMAAGLTFRNYGCFVDDWRYGLPKGNPARVERLTRPVDTRTRVAFPTRASLLAPTDPYYRGFDMDFADYWREEEWARELALYTSANALPSLETVRLPHDHLGSFATAEDGLTSPDVQIADHDYALGLLVERVSKSPFWESTLVVALEDDAQNGSDHVDAHRSLALFAGGHVKRGATISTPYTTVSVLRTIELLLNIPPLSQADALALPIDDILTSAVDNTPFVAVVPSVLRTSTLPLPPPLPGEVASTPRGTREDWARATAGMNFAHEDSVPADAWNRVLLSCLAGKRPCDPPTDLPAGAEDDDD